MSVSRKLAYFALGAACFTGAAQLIVIGVAAVGQVSKR